MSDMLKVAFSRFAIGNIEGAGDHPYYLVGRVFERRLCGQKHLRQARAVQSLVFETMIQSFTLQDKLINPPAMFTAIGAKNITAIAARYDRRVEPQRRGLTGIHEQKSTVLVRCADPGWDSIDYLGQPFA